MKTYTVKRQDSACNETETIEVTASCFDLNDAGTARFLDEGNYLLAAYRGVTSVKEKPTDKV